METTNSNKLALAVLGTLLATMALGIFTNAVFAPNKAVKAGYALPAAFGNQKFRDDLGGDGLPLLIILDKSGRIRLVHSGYDGSEPLQRELSKEIETLLHEA